MGDFISSTKMRTWRHSLIWFADVGEDAALAVDALQPNTSVQRGGEGGEDENEKGGGGGRIGTG